MLIVYPTTLHLFQHCRNCSIALQSLKFIFPPRKSSLEIKVSFFFHRDQDAHCNEDTPFIMRRLKMEPVALEQLTTRAVGEGRGKGLRVELGIQEEAKSLCHPIFEQ